MKKKVDEVERELAAILDRIDRDLVKLKDEHLHGKDTREYRTLYEIKLFVEKRRRREGATSAMTPSI